MGVIALLSILMVATSLVEGHSKPRPTNNVAPLSLQYANAIVLKDAWVRVAVNGKWARPFEFIRQVPYLRAS